MEPRETLDDDDGNGDSNRNYGGGGAGEPYHDQQRQTRHRQKWKTARTVVGVFSLLLSLALLALGVKMSVAYDEVHLIHVSVAFVGFTASTSIAWQLFEFIARCLRRDGRGIYPGVHVGVHICLVLACVATTGYVCFWVSQGDRWRFVEVHGEQTAYSPLYHIGIVVVILTAMLMMVHFVLSVLACQVIRRKEDNEPSLPVVRVRYDGVGPDGTARPLSYRVTEVISLPPYNGRSDLDNEARRISMARGHVRGADEISSSTNGTASPRTPEKSGSLN
ncbi:hypothetical protein B0T16DRAFT_326346 [Cercophora newfieldiana]|uniref:Uncharacterized protein n=1 Tax=Cercophora newfieldiana TaxID=92897 RepID=A0AA39Y9R8_9PEZI|nr:hypothetical protein B0T16DRAFT_326346 [Cercophora newfieldiana]